MLDKNWHHWMTWISDPKKALKLEKLKTILALFFGVLLEGANQESWANCCMQQERRPHWRFFDCKHTHTSWHVFAYRPKYNGKIRSSFHEKSACQTPNWQLGSEIWKFPCSWKVDWILNWWLINHLNGKTGLRREGKFNWDKRSFFAYHCSFIAIAIKFSNL